MASRLNGFLTGLKVVDFSFFLPGPLASLLMADMGAEVLKIEPPAGDEMQRVGPRNEADKSIYYNAVNAGKQSRRINLKHPQERLEALELIRAADVLIEGFRPGVMARLGLDYDSLCQTNAGLIYCSLNGYGADGPLANVAGHDGNYLSLSGVLHRNGVQQPMFFDPPVADTTGSLFAVIAILGALQERRRTGKGCQIDLALADVVMPLQLFPIAGFGVDGVAPARSSTYLNGGVAYYQVYETKDGRHVMLGAIEPKFWRAFCLAAGRPDWVERQFEISAAAATDRGSRRSDRRPRSSGLPCAVRKRRLLFHAGSGSGGGDRLAAPPPARSSAARSRWHAAGLVSRSDRWARARFTTAAEVGRARVCHRRQIWRLRPLVRTNIPNARAPVLRRGCEMSRARRRQGNRETRCADQGRQRRCWKYSSA